MLTFLKIIILAAVSAALAILVEQTIALAVNIFWQKEIVLDSFSHFTWFLATAAVIEEISKYWAVYFVLGKRFDFSGIKLVFASAFLGLGWGVFEIGLTLYSNQNYLAEFASRNPQIIFSFASITALHVLTALLMGIFVSTGTFPGRLRPLKIIFFPILIHLLFNFLIIQRGDFTNYLLLISLAIAFLVAVVAFVANLKKLAKLQY